MSKRRRDHQVEAGPEPDPAEPPDPDAWDAPEFRRHVLFNLAFVALPALVMVALGERAIAAVWFGVGALVIAFQIRRQLRDLWRSLRSREDGGREDGGGS